MTFNYEQLFRLVQSLRHTGEILWPDPILVRCEGKIFKVESAEVDPRTYDEKGNILSRTGAIFFNAKPIE